MGAQAAVSVWGPLIFIGLPVLICVVLVVGMVIYNRRHGRPALMPPGQLSFELEGLQRRVEAVERRLDLLDGTSETEGSPAPAGPNAREESKR